MNFDSRAKLERSALEDQGLCVTPFRKQLGRFAPTILFAIFFLAVWIARSFGLNLSVADGILLICATVATLHVLGQRLPLQNIFGLAVVITIFSEMSFFFDKLFYIWPLPAFFRFKNLPGFTFPFLWIIALVNARGIAKLILYRWRKTESVGLWLIALSSLLVTVVNPDTRTTVKFFLERFCFAAVVFIATTPWFLDKKRVEHPPDYQPLLITTLLFLW